MQSITRNILILTVSVLLIVIRPSTAINDSQLNQLRDAVQGKDASPVQLKNLHRTHYATKEELDIVTIKHASPEISRTVRRRAEQLAKRGAEVAEKQKAMKEENKARAGGLRKRKQGRK